LADMTQYCAYGKNAVYEFGHHGNALLSVYPIVGQTNTDVSDHSLEQRGILHCEVQAGPLRIYCYVVHLGLFKGSRIRQTKALIETVNRTSPPGAPIIIAGDFNDWQVNLSDMLRKGLGVNEVFDGIDSAPAKTFPAIFPFFRLDRIYTRGFSITGARVMRGRPWTQLSDHAPLFATLNIGI
ncbi:MAG: endonuclease, partial [Oxalobacter sp.]|nr:endonuclease [Oxalobacter sp.]